MKELEDDYIMKELEDKVGIDDTSYKQAELHGVYYFFDCLDASVNKLFKASEFKDDNEAISWGSNYEATVIKVEYRHGEKISSKVIYEPWACFE